MLKVSKLLRGCDSEKGQEISHAASQSQGCISGGVRSGLLGSTPNSDCQRIGGLKVAVGSPIFVTTGSIDQLKAAFQRLGYDWFLLVGPTGVGQQVQFFKTTGNQTITVELVLDGWIYVSPLAQYQKLPLEATPFDPKSHRASATPNKLVSFKSDETNEAAHDLFQQFSQRFDLGRSIALTRSELKKRGFDLTLADPHIPKTPVVVTMPQRKKVDPPAWFSEEELKYASFYRDKGSSHD